MRATAAIKRKDYRRRINMVHGAGFDWQFDAK